MHFDTFNHDDVLQEFGDEATAAELAAIVRTDVAQYAAALETAAAARDMVRVREVAHALRGAAGTVTATRVCDLASRIESGLRGGDPAVLELAPALVEECRRLTVDLGAWLRWLETSAPRAH